MKKKVIVTGCAGFIGSHLLSELLKQGYHVIGVDNLWTGTTKNIYEALKEAGPGAESRFEFHEKDVRSYSAYSGVDTVFHLAAVASVPGSIEKPLQSHQANVEGFFLMLNRARKLNVRRVVYASSSSVYGNCVVYPQREELIGEQTSPYAATKRINEVYAQCFSQSYGMESVGLRFFNVYGTRQSTVGAYPAVIAKWASAMVAKAPVEIYGDGTQRRDFTYVKDVVEVLIRSSQFEMRDKNTILNVGYGESVSLNELFQLLKNRFQYPKDPVYLPSRPGDRPISQADIRLLNLLLIYQPQFNLAQGIDHMLGESQ